MSTARVRGGGPAITEELRVLLRVSDLLESLGIGFHLAGSFASSLHGVPRQTRDADLVVDLREEHLESLAAGLEGEFYLDRSMIREAIRRRSSFNAIHLETGFKVDVFIRGAGEYDREEIARCRVLRLADSPELEIPVQSPEDAILRKLVWYRLGGEISDRQWSDVLGIVRVQGGRLDAAYLRRWAAVLDVADLLSRVLGEARAG